MPRDKMDKGGRNAHSRHLKTLSPKEITAAFSDPGTLQRAIKNWPNREAPSCRYEAFEE